MEVILIIGLLAFGFLFYKKGSRLYKTAEEDSQLQRIAISINLGLKSYRKSIIIICIIASIAIPYAAEGGISFLITLVFFCLFLRCWYIESNYRHMVHQTDRDMSEPTTSSKYDHWGNDIAVGLLLTIRNWLGIVICSGLGSVSTDITPFFHDSETLWWIIAIVFLYFYLETLIKRSKQINSGNQGIKHPQNLDLKFAPKISPIFTLWILILIIVPYATICVTYYYIQPSDYSISPDQYESNHTIMSQILQEVANTNASVRSEIRYFADRLYNSMLAGITSATVILGLLIFYRTRKSEENE